MRRTGSKWLELEPINQAIAIPGDRMCTGSGEVGEEGAEMAAPLYAAGWLIDYLKLENDMRVLKNDEFGSVAFGQIGAPPPTPGGGILFEAGTGNSNESYGDSTPPCGFDSWGSFDDAVLNGQLTMDMMQTLLDTALPSAAAHMTETFGNYLLGLPPTFCPAGNIGDHPYP